MGWFAKLVEAWRYRPPIPAAARPHPANQPSTPIKAAATTDTVAPSISGRAWKYEVLRQWSFAGPVVRSHNGQWLAGLARGDEEMDPRRLMLVQVSANRVAFNLSPLGRVEDVVVADNGTVAIHTASAPAGPLWNEVRIVGADGKTRYVKARHANLFNMALSCCGRFAVAQTCNAPNDDGDRFDIIDVDAGCTLASVEQPVGRARSYRFGIGAGGALERVFLALEGLQAEVALDAKGEVVDPDALMALRLRAGGETALRAAEELLAGTPSAEAVQRAMEAATLTLQQDRNAFGQLRAVAHRLRGDAFVHQGQLEQALAEYEKALQADPKVTVKQRMARVRKRLGITPPK